MCPFCSILFHSIPDRAWNSKNCEHWFGVLIARNKPQRKNVSSYFTISRDCLFEPAIESLTKRILWRTYHELLAHHLLENAVISDQGAGCRVQAFRAIQPWMALCSGTWLENFPATWHKLPLSVHAAGLTYFFPTLMVHFVEEVAWVSVPRTRSDIRWVRQETLASEPEPEPKPKSSYFVL